MGMYRYGCCSSGPAFGATADDGLDSDTLALLNRTRAAQAASGALDASVAGTTVAIDSPTDPPASAPFPWGKLLGVSVGAGLILHHLTKRRRR